MEYTINVTRIQENQYQYSIATSFYLPMKSLFQIARRRKTSRIFTTNEFNVVNKLLTSATLVLKTHDRTHSIASE